MDKLIVPDEVITNKIYFIRNMKVMLDRDLAELTTLKPKGLMSRLSGMPPNSLNILCFNLLEKNTKT
jgi:hypothetical protein